jgi:hypothetical protein
MLNPPSMETIFLALSGLILVAGVIYWLWSHLQLTQKKVQLLENAVFELRGMLASSSGGMPGPGPVPVPSPVDAPVPINTPYKDLADDDWEDDSAPGSTEAAPQLSTPLDVVLPVLVTREPELAEAEAVPDELAPGGRIQIGDSTTDGDNFRELFIATDAATAGSAARPESLEGMPVRELRRLAEQRGIRGVADMKKKELLAALRQQVAVPAPASAEPMTVGIVREGEAELLETEILE